MMDAPELKERRISTNDAFWGVYEVARRHSGMDLFRMYQLWSLMGQAAKLKSGDILEVGCASGGSGFVIASRARLSNCDGSVYLCDTFTGLVKSDDQVDKLKDGDMVSDPRGVAALMAPFEKVNVLKGVFPEGYGDFEDKRFRFVHLDVDIYRSARDAFEWIWPRMVNGGVLVVDDYLVENCPGITKLIHENVELPDCIWNFNGALQAIAVKI